MTAVRKRLRQEKQYCTGLVLYKIAIYVLQRCLLVESCSPWRFSNYMVEPLKPKVVFQLDSPVQRNVV